MTTIEVQLPTIDQVEFETLISEEHIPIRGNAMASGDDDIDKECEDAIIEDLENGNIWAWCSVEVRALWKGIEASDYLGACSYKSQKDFEQGDGYYRDMKNVAFKELIKKIKALA